MSGPVLILGGSGLVGGRLARALLANGHPVRCLARTPAKLVELANLGAEIAPGDMLDPNAVRRAVAGAAAVVLAVHTLSPQPGSAAGEGFMAIERQGLENVIAAMHAGGVRRVVYVTSLGIAPEGPGDWLRERWQAEQRLLNSGLDATVIRPGHIVGVSGHGFDAVVANAGKRVAVTLVGDRALFRAVAVDDLVADIAGVLPLKQAYGQRFDVGGDDILSLPQMIDAVAGLLGRKPPVKVTIPRSLLRAIAPVAGRMAKLPKGAFPAFVAGLDADSVGNAAPIRALLPRTRQTFREAAAAELARAATT